MKARSVTLLFLATSLVGFGLGFILKTSVEVGLCLVSEPSCINLYSQIGNALFYGMGALAVVFFLLLFAQHAFDAWKRFAIWYVPIVAFYFAIYESTGFFTIPAESVYRFFSIVYVVVSLVIIALASSRMKR